MTSFLRVQLFNDRLGNLLMNDIDPKGLDSFKDSIKRSADNEGVVYSFSTNLEFPKRAKQFIRQAYQIDGGIDAIIYITFYEYDSNAYKWNILQNAKLKLSNLAFDETFAATNCEAVGFQTKFLNLIDADVDLEAVGSVNGLALPDMPTINPVFHSKKILRRYFSSNMGGEDPVFNALTNQTGIYYFQFSPNPLITPNDPPINEYADGTIFTYPTLASRPFPPDVSQAFLKATEAGDYDIEVFLNFGVIQNVVGPSPPYEINHIFAYKVGGSLTEVTMSSKVADGNYHEHFIRTALHLEIGDEIYFYVKVNGLPDSSGVEFRNYTGTGPSAFVPTTISINGLTEFAASPSKAFLYYEVLNKIAQVNTDQIDCFRSTALGRTDTVFEYAEDGPASKLALTSGRCLRHLDNQQVFSKWSDAIKSVSSVFGLAWGFEKTTEGASVVVVEEHAHFYDGTNKIKHLGKIARVKNIIDMSYYNLQVEIGYPKVEKIDQVNSIDEFNTLRRFLEPVQNAKSKLDLKSVYHASGWEIESQRRLTDNTKDSQLDDTNFLVCMLRSGMDWITEQATNFSSVTGVTDPDSSYNLNISPARSLRRWLRVLSVSVILSFSRVLKFNYGEGNYLMASTKTGETEVAENGDIDMSAIIPLHVPERFEFTWTMSAQDWQHTKDNQYGFFSFTNEDDVYCEGFIIEVARQPTTGTVDFNLLRVYRPA